MKEQTLDLMRQSFPVVFQHKAEISHHFYQLMFRDAPETRAMFSENMGEQREVMASVLTALAKTSIDPNAVQETLDRLARSHANLGLTPRQFEVGEAALRNALISTMTGKVPDEVLAAWLLAVRRVIEAMQEPPDS